MSRELRRDWVAPDAEADDPWWAVYARLSLAGDEDETGVDRQVADCLADARRRGAKRIRIYTDDGISAYRRRVVRPDFERLLEDVEHGPLRHVVAWKAERLARQPRDAERLLDALAADEDVPRAVAYTIADGVDTSTEAGKFVFRQLVQFGRWESKAISQRVARAHQSRLEAGRFSGSPAAFGHRDGTGWREVDAVEAALIREGAARVLAGEGVRTILRDWGKEAVKTRAGNLWQHRAWIMMITSPRMAGLRLVRGVEASGTDADGQPWIAPILDVETWRDVRRILLDPARRPKNPGGTPKHLLTGLLTCGLCLGPLRAKGHAGKAHGPNYWTYGCVRDVYHPLACGRVWIKGDPTDHYIEQVVLAHLRMPEIIAALTRSSSDEDPATGEDDVRTRALALRERILAAEVAWMRGPEALEAAFGISPEAYRRWRTAAIAERDELEHRITRNARQRAALTALADPEGFWDQAALEQRREVVRAVLPEVVVVPAAAAEGSARRWNPRRIRWAAAE